jgi:hypothetical protein
VGRLQQNVSMHQVQPKMETVEEWRQSRKGASRAVETRNKDLPATCAHGRNRVVFFSFLCFRLFLNTVSFFNDKNFTRDPKGSKMEMFRISRA